MVQGHIVNILGFAGLCIISCNVSTLCYGKSISRQYINLWVRLCFNKTLSITSGEVRFGVWDMLH